jgi:DNA-binding HxlR family transcriptional regulator/putative sterol carrier protein
MANKRTYEDGCATAHALDLIGERWSLLIVRELILGPKRFTDLRASLPGISPNVLTMRLEELEKLHILRRRKLDPPAAAWVYELTQWGAELENVIMAIGRWGARSPSLMDGGYPLSIDALVLSLRTMFSGEAAQELEATIELRINDERFRARVENKELRLTRGAPEFPDARIEASPEALVEVVYGGRKLADAMRAGDVRVDGDRNIARRFVGLFPLPQPANPLG